MRANTLSVFLVSLREAVKHQRIQERILYQQLSTAPGAYFIHKKTRLKNSRKTYTSELSWSLKRNVQAGKLLKTIKCRFYIKNVLQ